MAAAGSVIAFAQFPSEALEAQADVVFPAQVYAEKEGTVTHPDGRVQRVRQALGLPGDSRPGWQVLEELCERLGAGTGALSASAVTGLIADAVPFYAGLTLDEIGGDGVRWQDRDAASAAPEAELSTEPLERQPPLRTDSCSAPHPRSGPARPWSTRPRFDSSPTGPQALLSVEDARELGVADGRRGRAGGGRRARERDRGHAHRRSRRQRLPVATGASPPGPVEIGTAQAVPS